MNLRTLVIDDETSFGNMVSVLLRKEGYDVDVVESASEGLEQLAINAYDLILCDITMPVMGGLDFLDALRERGLRTTTIMMSAYGNIEIAIEALKRGAYDYISKPFNRDEIVLTLEKATEREQLRRENQLLKAKRKSESSFGKLVGRSDRMERVYSTIEKVAPYRSTVLITGESGTGKELVAQAVHAYSDRVKGPFVAINCGAIPENLIESELFGYTKGAFTDARHDKKGLFEEANGGTLFLDEIGEIPLNMQVKLLRTLQESEVRPVGATRSVSVDTRIVAATIKDLATEVSAGRFREDLFYRLNVVPVVLPSLRDRAEDIPLLVEHFLEVMRGRLGTNVQEVHPVAMKALMDYGWPGNVRELENTVERAVVLSEGTIIEASSLPDRIVSQRIAPRVVLSDDEYSVKKAARVVEEDLIRKALKKTDGNRTAAAKLLELSHRALLYKIKSYHITDL